eukprot:TRINITY_DN3788_c0_g1_i2.p1 TRINITY_DN3788_c0_g1~~TRINITY_DN3788_c0_g1_i2.p1  ORF type:complete len:282 (-),score=41.39 TRINITY_DN3788_c0_g1_i2:13-858(-)
MDLKTLGKHCENEGCNQLDFLPFECISCHKIFCLEHKSASAHHCSSSINVVAPVCPICDHVVPVKLGDDVNIILDAHIAKGCVKGGSNLHACSLPNCKTKEVAPLICKLCNQNHCVRHRNPLDHQCSAQEKKVVKEKRQVPKHIGQIPQSALNNPMARKIALMKMKMHAVGDKNLPVENRYYLSVVFPADSKVTPKILYFDPAWTIGKVLDKVAEIGGIENKNNQTGAAKIHLIDLKTGAPMKNEEVLGSAKDIQSGDSVLLDTLETSDDLVLLDSLESME